MWKEAVVAWTEVLFGNMDLMRTTKKKPFRITGVRVEIWTWNTQYMKQDYCALEPNLRL
jgi:hypothetical protein